MDGFLNYAHYIRRTLGMVGKYSAGLSPILIIVLVTRTLHLLVDLCSPRSYRLKNLITILMGIVQLNQFIDKHPDDGLLKKYIISSLVISYITFFYVYNKFLNRPNGRSPRFVTYLSTAVTLVPMVILEALIHLVGLRSHAHLRSVVMTLTMKLSNALMKGPRDELACLAYFLHPSSVIFGPWNLLSMDYASATDTRLSYIKTYFSQLRQALSTLSKGAFILLTAQVITDLLHRLKVRNLTTKSAFMLKVFLSAQKYRFSHYFTIFLSGSLIVLWQNPNLIRDTVCDWINIEYPRSLVVVAKCWQLPVHTWFKTFIFNPILRRTSSVPIALISVYIISSIYHGIRLYNMMVLLSLCHLTFVEYKIRKHASVKLNACVLAKACTYDRQGRCSMNHMRTGGILVCCINAFFRILAIVHLSYLGYIFYLNLDEDSFMGALSIWAETYWFCIITGIIGHFILYGMKARRPLRHTRHPSE